MGVGAPFACTSRIDEFYAIRPCPVEHCEVGIDSLLPTLLVGTAEADKVVQLAVVEIGSSAVEQRTGGEEQCAGLDGKNCPLCHAAGIGCVPLVGNQGVGLVAELEYVVERALQRLARGGEVVVRSERLLYARHTSIAIEHTHITVGDKGCGLTSDTCLLGIAHIGHQVDVLFDEETLTDELPVVAVVIGSGIRTVGTVHR